MICCASNQVNELVVGGKEQVASGRCQSNLPPATCNLPQSKPMTEYRHIHNTTRNQTLLARAKWCDGFGSKLRGFTFRRHLAEDEGLVLVEGSDSRISTGIHMLFVFFDLAVIWVNNEGKVVDTVLARPWRPVYVPQAPARYVIEGHPRLLDEVAVGESIAFLNNT
jgi:uncharacterized membrane protein (UPF0127 family)